MACFYPLKGWRNRTTGKVTFKATDGWCDLPPAIVACGQCMGCRLERSRQWAVRMVHESKMHEANCFITLTYDDDNLPSNGSLDVTHWQDFAKRLRKKIGPFRFFHCGEYGEEKYRPHYHALLFGEDFRFDRKHLKQTKHGDNLYTSPTLDKAWGHGFANIGNFTFESAAYVARYCTKKITGQQAQAHYERVNTNTGEVFDLKPPYTTMSRRPGIGAAWFNKFHKDVYPSDEVIINAQKTRPPAYYDTQLDKRDPELLELLKKRRQRKAERHAKNNTPERLAVREEIQKHKFNQLRRDLQ